MIQIVDDVFDKCVKKEVMALIFTSPKKTLIFGRMQNKMSTNKINRGPCHHFFSIEPMLKLYSSMYILKRSAQT